MRTLLFSIVSAALCLPLAAQTNKALGPISPAEFVAADPATCVLASGRVIFNTTSNLLKYCSATNVWSPLAGGGGAATSNTYTFGSTATSATLGASPGTAIYSKTLAAGELANNKCMVLSVNLLHITDAAGINYDLDIGGQKLALWNLGSHDVSPWQFLQIMICNDNALVANRLTVTAPEFQFGASSLANPSFGPSATISVDMTVSQTVKIFAYGVGDTAAGRGFVLRVGL